MKFLSFELLIRLVALTMLLLFFAVTVVSLVLVFQAVI